MNALSEGPVVVGADPTKESARAVQMGTRLAGVLGTECRVVTVVSDVPILAAAGDIPFDLAKVQRETEAAQCSAVAHALGEHLGDVPEIICRHGRPEAVLQQYAADVDASILILGGKHHSRFGRWLAGSTAHYALRKLSIPVLVAGPGRADVHNVLAAVDLSSAAPVTLAMASRVAQIFGAQLKVIHVVPPRPALPIPVPVDVDEQRAAARHQLDQLIGEEEQRGGWKTTLIVGDAEKTLCAEATKWPADLLVLGSHGKGWIDRILIGSTTERLLDDLPTSLLVVPVPPPSPD